MFPRHKIFLFLLLSFILGIGLASFIGIDFFIIYCLFLVTIIFLFFFWPNKKLRTWGFFLIFICLGAWRYNSSWPIVTPNKVQFYNNQTVRIQGMIIKVDKRLNREDLILRVEKLFQERVGKKVSGRVLIYASLYSDYQYGNKLIVDCRLNEPLSIDDFQYHEYLAKENIYSTCFPRAIEKLGRGRVNFFLSFVYQVREKIKKTIDQNFTEPEGSIISAMLLGIKKEIPTEVRTIFSRSGTAHILAVSGLHVITLSKILLYLLILFFGLARPKAFYLVISFLIFYVILAGAPASAVRSAIMAGSILLAEKIGRKKESINLIFLTAFVMLLFNPKLLKSDIGFQLSFSAVLGITFLENYFFVLFNFLKFLPRKLRSIQNYLATTFSAYLFSLPLVLFYFGNLSLIAPISNVLVLPVLPIFMISGFIFAFGSLIYSNFGQFLFWPAWFFLKYIIEVVRFLSSLPYLSFNLGRINFGLVLLMYFFLIFLVVRIQKIASKQAKTIK